MVARSKQRSSDIVIESNNKTESEATVIKQVLLVTVGEDDQQDSLLPIYSLWKTLQIFYQNIDCERPCKLQDTIKGEDQRTYYNDCD